MRPGDACDQATTSTFVSKAVATTIEGSGRSTPLPAVHIVSVMVRPPISWR